MTFESEPQDKIKAKFYQNVLDGNFHKDLVRVILEMSGYEVYPYGYESFLTPLKMKFEKQEIKQTEISKKIRSTPDLLVIKDREVSLVEVKSRNFDRTNDVLIKDVSKYPRYWQDSILVVVVPAGHFFYAQDVSKLKIEEQRGFDLNEEFRWFEEMFTDVKLETLYSYKGYVIRFQNRPSYFYEQIAKTAKITETEERFNLYALIQQIGPCKIDNLFNEQNKRNLVSRKAFDEAIDELAKQGKVIKRNEEIRIK